jgi:hypothetical protein
MIFLGWTLIPLCLLQIHITQNFEHKTNMKFEVKTIQFAPNIYKKSFKRRFEFESISLKLQRAIKSLKKKKEKEEREKEGKKGGALGRL